MAQTVNITAGEKACDDIMQYVKAVSGVYDYDSRYFGYDASARPEYAYKDYFAQAPDSIFKQLGLGNSTKKPKFKQGSARVADALRPDNLIDYSDQVNYIIANNKEQGHVLLI